MSDSVCNLCGVSISEHDDCVSLGGKTWHVACATPARESNDSGAITRALLGFFRFRRF
jgi:hypothetical protein